MNHTDELSQLIAIASGQDENPITRQSNSRLTQYPGGQVLEPQQSAEEQAITANKVRESKAKADKAEIQAAQTVDSNFLNQATGFDASNFDFNANGALALNAPFATNGFTYYNGFNYDPSTNTTASNQIDNQQNIPENNQVTPQQGVPNQNNNNNLNQTNQANTITGIDGSTLPVVDLANISPQDLPVDISPEELLAYNVAQAKKAREQAKKDAYNRQIQEAKTYAETYGVTPQGTPYRKINGQAFPIPAFSEKGKEIIARFSAPIMAAALGIAVPQSTGLDSDIQQGAVTDAGNTVITQQQQQQTVTQQGALIANDPDQGIAYTKGGAVYKATPQELEGINIAKTAAINGKIGKPELTNMINSITSIKDNAIEELNRQAQLVGGATGLEYAIYHGNAGAEQVAQDMAAKYGLEKKAIAPITREINKMATKYPNLTPAVIGSVISGHSRNDSTFDLGFDTDLGEGLEYLDSEVNATLKALNNKSSSTSYESIKDTYNRCKDMMSNLNDVETSIEMAMKNYETHVRDLNAWGDNPENRLHRDWLKEDAENTNKYAYAAAIKAEEAFSKLGNFYKFDQRNTYPEAKAKASTTSTNQVPNQSNKSSTTTATKVVPPQNQSALEKASGFGIYVN